MKFIVGKKLHMTRLFQDDGRAVPVTVVQAGPCVVTDVKTEERDGYQAIQVGFGAAKKASKSVAGHLKGKGPFRVLKEFRVDSAEGIEQGKTITASTFVEGDAVQVVGVSKGKGFQGVVKRHGFAGSPASHGHKDQLRMPGSIGSTDPARVFKGTRMGGHMGSEQVTVTGLKVVKVDEENNELYVSGAVPGARGSFLFMSGPGDLVLQDDAAAQEEVSAADEKAEAPAEEKQEEKVEEKKEEAPGEKAEEKEVSKEVAVEETKEEKSAEEAEDSQQE